MTSLQWAKLIVTQGLSQKFPLNSTHHPHPDSVVIPPSPPGAGVWVGEKEGKESINPGSQGKSSKDSHGIFECRRPWIVTPFFSITRSNSSQKKLQNAIQYNLETNIKQKGLERWCSSSVCFAWSPPRIYPHHYEWLLSKGRKDGGREEGRKIGRKEDG